MKILKTAIISDRDLYNICKYDSVMVNFDHYSIINDQNTYYLQKESFLQRRKYKLDIIEVEGSGDCILQNTINYFNLNN